VARDRLGPEELGNRGDDLPEGGARRGVPRDEGRNYAQNPGEAWAEVYRLLEERRDGITTGTWPIIAPAFYPDEAALQAAERDVLQPWTRGTVASFKRTFTGRGPKVWWIPLSTPLDGSLRVTAALPRGGRYEVTLVGPNRRTTLQRAQWAGPRSKRIETTVCGHRSLFVRVALRARPGPVAVSVSTP
jgi:hypothetical protein